MDELSGGNGKAAAAGDKPLVYQYPCAHGNPAQAGRALMFFNAGILSHTIRIAIDTPATKREPVWMSANSAAGSARLPLLPKANGKSVS